MMAGRLLTFHLKWPFFRGHGCFQGCNISEKQTMLNPKIDALGDGNFSGAMRGYAKLSHEKKTALLSIGS